MEDLVIEAMGIYGMDVYYMPRSTGDEVDLLYGDSFETMKVLNWKPKVSFNELVKKMIENDIKLLE